jgi:rSAM/selenodomain-associated transferase 1
MTHDEAGCTDRDILYIAARAPRIGEAKTRLGAVVGHECAIALYQAFLRDLSAQFAQAPFRVGWYITPEEAWPEFVPYVNGQGAIARVLGQGPGNWAERQSNLFRHAASRGEDRVVLIGSDAPQLGTQVVLEAFGHLDRADIVLGPVRDGGYGLIGMRHWHDVLHQVPMSTNTVLEDVIARARAAGLSVALVPETFDVDEATDLDELRQHLARTDSLPATFAAMRHWGLLGAAMSPQPSQRQFDRS